MLSPKFIANRPNGYCWSSHESNSIKYRQWHDQIQLVGQATQSKSLTALTEYVLLLEYMDFGHRGVQTFKKTRHKSWIEMCPSRYDGLGHITVDKSRKLTRHPASIECSITGPHLLVPSMVSTISAVNFFTWPAKFLEVRRSIY